VIVRRLVDEVDERLDASSFIKHNLRKVFPDHWSFMLGELALYSFAMLLLTGIFLSLFFVASPAETIYQGPYAPMQGRGVSLAYESVLRLSFEVRCPIEHAFAVWTARTSRWWPTSHTVSGEPGLEVVFEAWPGGRVFERTAAGVEVDWGEITVWEPPRRLVYLWHMRADRSDATEVEITFVDQGDATTRVDIEHRGWERLGARGPNWRDANQSGWNGLLPYFMTACSGSLPRERAG